MEQSDLISRKALLEAFSADTQHVRCWDVDLYDLMVAEIEDAPAVEAEPVRHGRWAKRSDFMPIYECSICGQRNLFNGGNNVLSPYCPNCGAKMDLEVSYET